MGWLGFKDRPRDDRLGEGIIAKKASHLSLVNSDTKPRIDTERSVFYQVMTTARDVREIETGFENVEIISEEVLDSLFDQYRDSPQVIAVLLRSEKVNKGILLKICDLLIEKKSYVREFGLLVLGHPLADKDIFESFVRNSFVWQMVTADFEKLFLVIAENPERWIIIDYCLDCFSCGAYPIEQVRLWLGSVASDENIPESTLGKMRKMEGMIGIN